MKKDSEPEQSKQELLDSLKSTECLYYQTYIEDIKKLFPNLVPDNVIPDARFYAFITLIIVHFIYDTYGEDFLKIHPDYLKNFLKVFITPSNTFLFGG